MTREYHLSYCKQCTKRAFNSQKGIVCTLTGEHADFDEECPDFEIDQVAAEMLAAETEAKEELQLSKDTMGLSGIGIKNRKTASWILIVGGILWITLGFILIDRIFFWPFFIVGFGIYMQMKTRVQEKGEKRRDKSVLDDIEV